ncbi:hypothetical protein PROFUN_05084, partial [Planoprotostelium fungivorum]
IWLFALPGLSFWSISPGHLTGLSARPLRAAHDEVVGGRFLHLDQITCYDNIIAHKWYQSACLSLAFAWHASLEFFLTRSCHITSNHQLKCFGLAWLRQIWNQRYFLRLFAAFGPFKSSIINNTGPSAINDHAFEFCAFFFARMCPLDL